MAGTASTLGLRRQPQGRFESNPATREAGWVRTTLDRPMPDLNYVH